MNKRFNIRVYGLLINDNKEVLISKEKRFGKSFSKFPGGGLEWGEGTIDCLKREYKEELNIEISELEHYYTTDFFQESAFRQGDQLISIYYKVKSVQSDSIPNGFSAVDVEPGDENFFYWIPIKDLSEEMVSYPIDKKIVRKLINN